MKAAVALIVVAISILVPGPRLWAASQPFTLTLGVEEPIANGSRLSDGSLVVKAGSKIYLTIDTTNTSKHKIGCEEITDRMIGLDPTYQYDVRDSRGTPVRQKEIKYRELASRDIHGIGCTLKPGQSSRNAGNDIMRLYDLSQPGSYTIQVSRPVSGKPKDGVVKSNVLRLTITE